MRRAIANNLFASVKRMWGVIGRQTIMLGAFALLAACDFESKPLGVIGHVTESFGGAAADEPLAAIIARDALSAGGSAADAAVALYFGLAVTYPVAAGISGGGVCVAHSGVDADTAVIDFRLRGSGAVAAPGNVRGMAALHARFGRLRWEQLVLPAERLARFGHRISRALARTIPPSAERLRQDPTARALFFDRTGAPLKEGDHLEQVALATVLGRIRTQGAGALHNGAVAKRYVESARVLGARLPLDVLRTATPRLSDPQSFPYRNHVVSLVPGSNEAALWRRLFVEKSYDGGANGAGAVAVARAALEQRGSTSGATSNGGAATGVDAGLGTTGFVAIDKAGGVVACGLSMNGAFGTGRMLPGIGAFATAPPTGGGLEDVSVAVIGNKNTGDGVFAVAASGGAVSASALSLVAGRALFDDAPLATAVADRRAAADARRGLVLFEPGVPRARLPSVGGGPVQQDRIGRANAIYCTSGIKNTYKSCRFAKDPRWFGLAVSADK